MARTVDEIKEQMAERWMHNADLKELYGWELDENNEPPAFNAYYSKASIENILLYIVAYCGYVIEVITDNIKAEIEAEIATKVPGSLQWYVTKIKEFVFMPSLSVDDRDKVVFDDNTGEYIIDNTLNDDALTKARLVKHAVAIDDNVDSVLLLKVAGENEAKALVPLSEPQAEALNNYISRIKYAGVKTKLINEPGDLFNCEVDIWYDALYTESEVKTACEKAIGTYIKSLPFNGEYSNMALVDCLQGVKGVKVAELTKAGYIIPNDGREESIDAKVRPYAGYFNVGTLTLKMHCYE